MTVEWRSTTFPALVDDHRLGEGGRPQSNKLPRGCRRPPFWRSLTFPVKVDDHLLPNFLLVVDDHPHCSRRLTPSRSTNTTTGKVVDRHDGGHRPPKPTLRGCQVFSTQNMMKTDLPGLAMVNYHRARENHYYVFNSTHDKSWRSTTASVGVLDHQNRSGQAMLRGVFMSTHDDSQLTISGGL